MLTTKTFDSIIYSGLGKTEIQQCKIFIHFLIQYHLQYFGYPKHNFLIELSRTFIRKNFFNHKSKALHHLKELNIVVSDEKYIFTGESKCKKYKLCYFGDHIVYDSEIELNKTNQRHYNNIYRSVIIPCNEAHKQIAFISKLTIEGYEETIHEKRVNASKRKAFHLDVLGKKLGNFNSSKMYWKTDDFAGRHYNFSCNISDYVEDSLLYNNSRLSTLDIVSSQLYFISQLDKCRFLEEFGITQQFFIDGNFKSIVLEGDIYVHVRDSLKLKDRNDAKKKMLSFLYGSLSSKRNKKVADSFRREFPQTFNTIKFFKMFSTGLTKFENTVERKNYSYSRNTFFNYVVARFEKESFYAALASTDGYYTKHDSVTFTEGREEHFRHILGAYFQEMGMDMPKLKLKERNKIISK